MFDLSEVQEETAFGTLEPGEYDVHIVKSELVDTKTGGKMIKLQMKTESGRFIFENLNVVNKNEISQNMSRARMKRICVLNNVLEKDLRAIKASDLEGMKIRVETIVKTDDYGEKAVVKGVNSYGEPFKKNNKSGKSEATETGKPAPVTNPFK